MQGYAQWEAAVSWSAMTITHKLTPPFFMLLQWIQPIMLSLPGRIHEQECRYFASYFPDSNLVWGNSGLLVFQTAFDAARKFTHAGFNHNHRLAK